MRHDLLSLTLDDLIALSNRGTVKRAQRELDEQGRFDLYETPEGAVTVTWADGVICQLPPNTALPKCECSCPAGGVCRHLVQSVLAYQQTFSEQESPPTQAWNPGDISDETLLDLYGKTAFTRLRKQFKEPHVFELIRGIKPSARIHTLSCTVRFMVPNDPHYVTCDCAEPAPCSHIPLAVWAFRQFEGETGLIETGQDRFALPVNTLDEIEQTLGDLLELGFAGSSLLIIQRLRQIARCCRSQGLIWPAELLEEIAQEYDRYVAQDARFEAASTAGLMGELLIRLRALRHPTGAVIPLFVRGIAADKITTINTARMIGLGGGVEVLRRAVRLSVYLQDADTGIVTTLRRDFDDPANAEPLPYWQLARAPLLRDSNYALLGTQELLVKGGKRTANGLFTPGRAAIHLQTQVFDWEHLRAPLLVDNFAEMRARFASRPPVTLRPRRIGDDLQACAVRSVDQVMFDPYHQAVVALLSDETGEQMPLIHPYASRGSEGVDALLWVLRQYPLRFICGRMRPDRTIAPLSLIFEVNGSRMMFQPWFEQRGDQIPVNTLVHHAHNHSSDPLVYYPEQMLDLLGALLLNGVQGADRWSTEQYQRVAQEGQELGFVRFVRPLIRLGELLAQRQQLVDWNWRQAVPLVFDMMILARFAQEEITKI